MAVKITAFNTPTNGMSIKPATNEPKIEPAVSRQPILPIRQPISFKLTAYILLTKGKVVPMRVVGRSINKKKIKYCLPGYAHHELLWAGRILMSI